MQILVRGALTQSTGYGNDVVGLLEQLVAEGDDVYVWPTFIEPPLPRKVVDLLLKPLRPKYDAVLLYDPPSMLDPRQYRTLSRVVLGWTMWERSPFSAVHLPWVVSGNGRASAPPFTGMDALIVTCPMNVEAFRAADPEVDIRVIPPGIQPDSVPLWDRRTGDGPVVFGACGVMSARKDPFKLLEAWRDFRVAHPEIAARLEIKTMPPTLHPKIVEAYPDVVIHEEMWTRGRLMDWYGTLDCMVSTSRGEGMNKPAVEFMASGGPVLASAWGGHENWMRADCGYPVKYELSPCPFEPGTVDAPVDRQDLAAMFHAVALDRPGRLARGATAANYARSALTWERSVEKLRRLVAEKS